jgi:hypothetical protein
MNTIKSYSDLLAVNELFKELKDNGILKIDVNYIEVSNSLWLLIATDQHIFEYDGHEYGDYHFRLSIKQEKLIIMTTVESKNYIRFMANIKAKPSLFQKIFLWIANYN